MTRVEVRGRPEPLHKGGLWSSMREFPTQRTFLSAVSSIPHPQDITLTQFKLERIKQNHRRTKIEWRAPSTLYRFDVVACSYLKHLMHDSFSEARVGCNVLSLVTSTRAGIKSSANRNGWWRIQKSYPLWKCSTSTGQTSQQVSSIGDLVLGK